MAFIVKKKINGKEYYYLNENKRVDGKVKTKTLAYLGKTKKAAEAKAKKIINEIGEKKTKINREKKIKIDREKKIRKEEKRPGTEKNLSREPKDFVSFVQEAGLIWGPEPEIYGGLAGFYTYGPLGKLLKNKVENSVRKVFNSHGFRELEGPTVLPNIVWKASGHLETFKDRIIKCTKCKAIFRVDKLIEENYEVPADSFSNEKILKFIDEKNVKCPSCKGDLENFIGTQNLMMTTNVAGQDAALRPETATVTYLPFIRFYNYFRKKLPFGVFQIGKAYRNEISPRQNVLRGREFTQAEGQIFIDPKNKDRWDKYEDIKNEKLPFWDYKSQEKEKEVLVISIGEALKKKFVKTQAYAWCLWLAYQQFIGFGIPKEKIRLRQHHPDEKAFYADDAWDVEINLNNYGWTEVCGVHDRTDYDLKQHSKFSGEKLIAQRENGEEFIPHVLEIAFGTDRPTYSLIDLFYKKKTEEEGKTIFKIPYHVAPIDVAIFPLMNKPGLFNLSREVKEDLEKEFVVEHDVSGSIGRRYLRSSTKGIPYAVTIDFDSLEKRDVTIRDRDTAKQIRVRIDKLKNILKKLIDKEIEFEDAGNLLK